MRDERDRKHAMPQPQSQQVKVGYNPPWNVKSYQATRATFQYLQLFLNIQ